MAHRPYQLILAAVAVLFLAAPVYAQPIGKLPAAASAAGRQLPCATVNVSSLSDLAGCTPAQIVAAGGAVINSNASNLTTGTVAGARLPAFTGGDVTAPAGNTALTLNTVLGTPGTCGSSSQSCVLTFDGKGRATAFGTATIPAGAAYTAGAGLGLSGGAFSATFGSIAGTIAQGNDSRITGALQGANNLSDLASATTSRSNLGVSATGADTTYANRANNLSDLASAVTARTNLGLGTAAVAYTGTSGSTVPLLSGVNTWSSTQTFSASPSIPTPSVGTNTAAAASMAAVQAALPCVSILAYGGDPTDTNDNSSALSSAEAAALSSDRVCVYFPAGKYKFTSSPNYAFPSLFASVHIFGAGPEVTLLDFPSTSGLKFTAYAGFNSNVVTLHDMSIMTGSSNVGTGLNLVNNGNGLNTAQSNIYNLAFRGSDSLLGTYYWTNAIKSEGWSEVNYTNVAVYGRGNAVLGNGIVVQGRSSGGTATITSVVTNVINSNFYGLAVGFTYGSGVQGVAISGCNFTTVNYGVYAPSGGVALDQLLFRGNQIQANQVGVFLTSEITSTNIANNYFIVGTTSTPSVAVDIEPASNFVLQGNHVNIANTYTSGGFTIGGGGATNRGGVVTGNQFYGVTANAVQLTSSATRVVVIGNQYFSVGATVSNSGSGNTIGCPSGTCP